MTKRFISRDESIMNVATDELMNASSEESAKILVDWLNEFYDENEQLKSELSKQKKEIKRLKKKLKEHNDMLEWHQGGW